MRLADKQRVSIKKGQAAMEYLFVVGFAFALLIPIILLYYTQSNSFEEEVRFTQAKNALEEITQAANNVYYLGPPSKNTIRVRIPQNTMNIELIDNMVLLSLDSSGGLSTISSVSVANLTGTIPPYPGVHTIVVTATSEGVSLHEG